MSMQLHHTLMSQYKHGTASGIGSVSYDSVANCVTPEVVIYGKCVQNGTPTPDAPVEIVANNNVYEVNKKFDFPIPTLYAVGNVRDEYYPQTGKIVRRCKKVELTSASNLTQYSTRMVWVYWNRTGVAGYKTSIWSHFNHQYANWADSYNGTYGTYSSHMDIGENTYLRQPNESVDTTEKFKAWLDEQKAKGTPVIGILQSTEPVIEYVEPIPIRSARGENIIEETDLGWHILGMPYVADTQIEVKYLTHS